MARYILIALAFLGLPAFAAAQRSAAASPPRDGLPSIGLPLPQIAAPLPPIGLPLPPIGLPPQRRTTSSHPVFGTQTDQLTSGHKRRFHARPAIIYFGVPYAWDFDTRLQAATPGVVVPDVASHSGPSSTGRLRLEVHPADALQLYVDGEYVGTPDDVGGELDMEPGSRRIEIRAPGFETLVFDAKIVAGRTITYRGMLLAITPIDERESGASREPAAPATRDDTPAPAAKQTLYFIPGCYIGNVPPHEVRLPSDCDLSRLVTWTP